MNTGRKTSFKAPATGVCSGRKRTGSILRQLRVCSQQQSEEPFGGKVLRGDLKGREISCSRQAKGSDISKREEVPDQILGGREDSARKNSLLSGLGRLKARWQDGGGSQDGGLEKRGQRCRTEVWSRRVPVPAQPCLTHNTQP